MYKGKAAIASGYITKLALRLFYARSYAGYIRREDR